eukprot:s2531_g11.t1
MSGGLKFLGNSLRGKNMQTVIGIVLFSHSNVFHCKSFDSFLDLESYGSRPGPAAAMRLPIEWQRIKEEAFAHPCLVAACLTGWPALHCLSLCLSILGGEVVSSWAFRFVLTHLLQWRTLTDGQGGDQPLTSEEAKLAGNFWQLSLLGIATSIPPAAVIAVISLMHLGGELSLRRAKLAITGQLIATLWEGRPS